MRATATILGLLGMSCALCAADIANRLSPRDRSLGFRMLEQVRRDIEENHFDPALKGVNLSERFNAARGEIEAAKDNGDVFRAIASAVRSLKDSRTQFVPPGRAATYNYGWDATPCGRECIINDVDPAGPAAGLLAPGDRLLAINGAAIDRATWPAWTYYLQAIEPHAKLRLVVAAPEQPPREVEVVTLVTPRAAIVDLSRVVQQILDERDELERETRSTFKVYDNVLVWRLKTFTYDENDIRSGLRRARGHQSLILDLRGNGGGNEPTMERLIGGFFDRDVGIGTLKKRAGRQPLTAKSSGRDVWAGRLLVLVDGETGGAAEIFAATIQREGRGLLVGDHTAGVAQQGNYYSHSIGANRLTLFGVFVATAEFELADGRTIEGSGLTPDFLIIRKPADVAAQNDPVLAMALKQFGVTRSAAGLGRDYLGVIEQ
ncbi:peptidase S41 [Opitutus terrae PB90-1]|uniref:Peptidase S41 n=2 Tax=Opitutus terrae TaxID=107709 RepID=B1ZVC7_OPITP|nr:peptidase S41 [Opitutus terrae PB90-1]